MVDGEMVLWDTLETYRRAPASELGAGKIEGSRLGMEVFSDVLALIPGALIPGVFTWPKLIQ